MILSEHGVDSLNPVSFGRPEECGRLLVNLRGRARWPLILVSGPSGVGKRGLIRRSLLETLRRLHPGNHLPVQISIPVTVRDSPTSIARHCIRAIVENHPGFQRRASYEALGKKLANLAETDPVGVGRRLSALLQRFEKGTSGLAAVKVVIIIEGLDNLFVDRKRCEDDAGRPRVLSGQRDPFGFLREMLGARSVLFSLTYRTWVGDLIRKVISQSILDESEIYFCELDYPCPRNINAAVAAHVNEVAFPDTSKPKLKRLAHAIREDFYEAPQCLSLLPRLLDRLQDEAESLGKSVCLLDYTGTECLAGFVCNLAEEIFLMKDVSRQAIWEELFREASKSGDYTLKAADLAKDAELWNLALELTDWRLFTIEGSSLKGAVFHPIHDALYHKWERAKRWTRDGKPSLAAVRQFDEHAIAWEVSNRSSERLLDDDEKLESASQVLRDRDVKHYLSPLTGDYLKASLRRRRREKNIYRATVAAGVAAALGLIGLVAGVTWYNLSEHGVGIASVIPPDSESSTSTKVVSPFVGNLPRVETVKKKSSKEPAPKVSSPKEKTSKRTEAIPSKTTGTLLSNAEINEAIYGRQGTSGEEVLASTLTGQVPAIVESALETEQSTIDKTPPAPVSTEVVDTLPVVVEDDALPTVDDAKMREEVAQIAAVSLKEEAALPPPTDRSLSSPKQAAVAPVNFETPSDESRPGTPENKKPRVNLSPADLLPDSSPGESTAIPSLEMASLDPTVRTVEAPKPVKPAPTIPKPEIPKPEMPKPGDPDPVVDNSLPIPEGMNQETPLAKVMSSFKETCEKEDVDSAVTHLILLHDQSTAGGASEKVGELGADLAMNLGKLARKQSDSKAVEKSWKLGFAGGGAHSGDGLSKDLRLLMARIAHNAGRDREAALFLSHNNSRKSLSEDDLKIGAAVIEWHFGNAESASEKISALPPNSLKASTIEPLFLPEKWGRESVAGEVGVAPEG